MYLKRIPYLYSRMSQKLRIVLLVEESNNITETISAWIHQIGLLISKNQPKNNIVSEQMNDI